MTENETQKPQSSENGWQPGSREEWHARSLHKVELWSGMRVTIRFRSLGELIARGDLPDDLLKLAWLEVSEKESGGIVGAIAEELQSANPDEGAETNEEAQKASLERVSELGDGAARLVRELVAFSLVEPKLTVEDLASPDFPMQDLEMLAGIINRQVTFDAAGRRMGVEPLETFATFRERHSCPAGCPACEASRRELSSVHVGPL